MRKSIWLGGHSPASCQVLRYQHKPLAGWRVVCHADFVLPFTIPCLKIVFGGHLWINKVPLGISPQKQLAHFNPVAIAKHGQSHGIPTRAAATADTVALLPFTASTLPFCLSCSFVHGSLRPVRALACCLSNTLSTHSAFFDCAFHAIYVRSHQQETCIHAFGDQTCKIVDYYSLSLQAHWVTLRYSTMPVPHHESITRCRSLFFSSSPLRLRPSIASEPLLDS